MKKHHITHTLKSVRTLAATLITFGALAGGANGAVIADNLNAPNLTAGTLNYGQSFTISASSSWNNLTFNFWSVNGNPASVPFAVGSLFLLGAEYSGTSAALGISTPGFIAQTSNISGGIWMFAPSVSLNPNTQYWIFTQGSGIPPIAFNATNNYSGGIPYQESGAGFGAVPSADIGFSINGTAVPEPSSAFLCCLGTGGLIGRRRRTP